jgi:ABC-type transport system involved in multi-copper enzyme maturation permease subunit
MRASLEVELFKLIRRPAIWVLGITWLLLGVLFGYLLPYLLYRAQAGPSGFSIPLEGMLPAAIVENAIQGFPLFGLALALVVGGLAVGSEYGWDTWTTVLVQRPDRLRILAGKLAAVGTILLALTVASFVAAGMAALAVAMLEGADLRWPSPWILERGLGAGWLILATGASIGIAGATLLRGSTLVVGLGVLYVSVVEALIGGFARQSEVLTAIAKVLPGTNAGSLASAFVPYVQAGGTTAPGMVSIVPPAQGAAVLALYTAVLLGISLVIFRRRDVTASA